MGSDFDECRDGKYALKLDRDGVCHSVYLLKTLNCTLKEGESYGM